VRWRCDTSREVLDHPHRAAMERQIAAAEVHEEPADVTVVVHGIQ
jgi:hypothetical protein